MCQRQEEDVIGGTGFVNILPSLPQTTSAPRRVLGRSLMLRRILVLPAPPPIVYNSCSLTATVSEDGI